MIRITNNENFEICEIDIKENYLNFEKIKLYNKTNSFYKLSKIKKMTIRNINLIIIF